MRDVYSESRRVAMEKISKKHVPIRQSLSGPGLAGINPVERGGVEYHVNFACKFLILLALHSCQPKKGDEISNTSKKRRHRNNFQEKLSKDCDFMRIGYGRFYEKESLDFHRR